MKYKRGDLIRLRELPILSDLRVGSVQGSSLWCTCTVAGHEFSGYVSERDVFKVGGRV
jgi:hypothetical protein